MIDYLIFVGIFGITSALIYFIVAACTFANGPRYRKAENAKHVKISSVALVLSPFAGAVIPIAVGMGIIYGLFKVASVVWSAWHYEPTPR